VHEFVHGFSGTDRAKRDGEGSGRLCAVGLPRSTRWPETVHNGRDARRMAHNPEVEGSNPSPATKARGPFSNRERAFCLCSALAQADLLETREPPMISSPG